MSKQRRKVQGWLSLQGFTNIDIQLQTQRRLHTQSDSPGDSTVPGADFDVCDCLVKLLHTEQK